MSIRAQAHQMIVKDPQSTADAMDSSIESNESDSDSDDDEQGTKRTLSETGGSDDNHSSKKCKQEVNEEE